MHQLKGHLKGVPEQDQEDFIKEIESHIYESYQNEKGKDEVERILNVLEKLGEPEKVFSEKMPDAMVKKGKDKNLPLYIISGVLIALFGLPIGIGGIAVLISIIGTVFSLIVAYFATAISFIVGGFAGAIISIIHIINPEFLDQFIDTFHFGPRFYFSNPTVEGIVGLLVSLILAGIGILLLFLGKYIFRGIRFLTNMTIQKVKDFRKKS
jgi:uncharacterized membrane protein